MSIVGDDKANEFTFQNDMIKQFIVNGWLLDTPEKYKRAYGYELQNIN